MVAAEVGNLAFVREHFIDERGADILLAAARGGQLELVKFLVEEVCCSH